MLGNGEFAIFYLRIDSSKLTIRFIFVDNLFQNLQVLMFRQPFHKIIHDAIG